MEAKPTQNAMTELFKFSSSLSPFMLARTNELTSNEKKSLSINLQASLTLHQRFFQMEPVLSYLGRFASYRIFSDFLSQC